jgi:hypothetical protein
LHLHELLHAVGAFGPLLGGIVHLARRTVAGDHPVVAFIDQPAHHIEAHPAHAVDSDVHCGPPSGRRQFSAISY